MPWTFSHPLAVVPAHRLFRGRLNFAGLVIGSLSPDFAYYGKQFPLATFAHTLPGTLSVCLPAGLVVLGLFYALRPALCFILPQPHRAALVPLASVRPRLNLGNLGIAAGSVLLGAWSHTLWDSFTHQGGWAVEHIPILSKPLISIANTPLPLYYLLQQGSTLGAAVILSFLYFRWLRRQSPPPGPTPERISDRWRYFLWGAMAVIAILTTAPLALQMASRYEGYLAFRVFLFRIGIYSTMAFLPLLVICSLVLYSRFRAHRL
jgi:hypothetical protein